MKHLFAVTVALVLISCGRSQEADLVAQEAALQQVDPTYDVDATDEDTHVMTPQEELDYITNFEALGKASTFRFSQTSWNECEDSFTGNYLTSNCSKGRRISNILKTFISSHMYKCINKGLEAQGGGQVADYHIVHAGIFGDPRHSPRSLHAENRAIDIKSFEVQLTNGSVKAFTFSGTKDRSFFTAFRSCWGEIVNTYNGCPIYNGVKIYTGSIGWEDKNHQHHMHTSVPYCLRGSYGAYYYRR